MPFNWSDRQINSTNVLWYVRSPSDVFIGFQISFKRWKNIFTRDLFLARLSRTVEPHTSSSWTRVADKIALTRGVTKYECHQTKKSTVESREVGLTRTEYQKSVRENYTHSSVCLVTFALCHFARCQFETVEISNIFGDT